MQANLIIASTNATGSKKINTTISYFNPNQKSKAANLAQMLNMLTTNVFTSATINELNVNQADKTTPVLSIGDASLDSSVTGYKIYDIEYSYSGNGNLSFTTSTPNSFLKYKNSTTLQLMTASNTTSVNVTLYATETTDYNSAETSAEVTLPGE